MAAMGAAHSDALRILGKMMYRALLDRAEIICKITTRHI